MIKFNRRYMGDAISAPIICAHTQVEFEQFVLEQTGEAVERIIGKPAGHYLGIEVRTVPWLPEGVWLLMPGRSDEERAAALEQQRADFELAAANMGKMIGGLLERQSPQPDGQIVRTLSFQLQANVERDPLSEFEQRALQRWFTEPLIPYGGADV